MKRINIMTSCDNNLAQWIPTQITSIGVNLHSYDIHFYLFHYRISAENIAAIKNHCKKFPNITFHEIIIQNLDMLEKLTKHGGKFPPEAYVYLHCYEQFPEETDRVLYIDAGDVIIHGDISEYYFADFEGKSIIGTAERIVTFDENGNPRPAETDDLNDITVLESMRSHYINSGSIVLNIKKLRANGSNVMENYLHWLEKMSNMDLPTIENDPSAKYWGDQGLLGIAYTGDVKIFGFEMIIKNLDPYPVVIKNGHTPNIYAPYNFTQGLSRYQNVWRYSPVIIHYAGVLKPWRNLSVDNMEKMGESGWFVDRLLDTHEIWRNYWKTTQNLSPTLRRDGKITKINPIWFLAEYNIDIKNHSEAQTLINSAKVINDENNSTVIQLVLTHLQMRLALINEDDSGYHKALLIANEYIHSAEKPEYTSLGIYCRKAECHFKLNEYHNAAMAYEICYNLSCTRSSFNTSLEMVHLSPLLLDVKTEKRFYAKEIINCYSILKKYDAAFLWLSRISPIDSDDVKNYFRLINETGQINRVEEIFDIIEKSESHEGFAAFNEIVLTNPHAAVILAPFFQRYVALTKKFQGVPQ